VRRNLSGFFGEVDSYENLMKSPNIVAPPYPQLLDEAVKAGLLFCLFVTDEVKKFYTIDRRSSCLFRPRRVRGSRPCPSGSSTTWQTSFFSHCSESLSYLSWIVLQQGMLIKCSELFNTEKELGRYKTGLGWSESFNP
jgi:hypothetical protein